MPSTPPLCPPRALAAAALLACAIAAHAQAPRSYDLPAQPLGSTLARIAADSGQQISIDAALVRGRTAPAVQGRYTAEQAARAALAGSGLELVRTDNGNWALRRAAAATAGTTSAQVSTAAALPTVTVTGAAIHETAYGPVGGFVATRSATATKTDTRLFETAQSVSVVPREQMQAQAADSLDQALEYTAGVSKFEGGGTRSAGTRISVRGFNTTGTEALYLDGSKFPANSLSGSLEPYHFERIELLKGPASIMYGQGTPGGIINLVSKRPTAAPLREVEVQAGSWSRKQVAVDLGGPVTEDGRIRYRLAGLQRDSESMIRQNPNDRTSLSAALDWQLTDATLLTLLGAYDTAHAAFDPGKPLDGILLPNPAGRISRHLFVGEPGANRHDSQGTRLGYQLEHAFNGAWKFRQNLLAYDYDIDSDYVAVYPRVAAATPRLAQRYAVLRTDGDKGTSLDNQLHGTVRHGRFEHTLLFGLEAEPLRAHPAFRHRIAARPVLAGLWRADLRRRPQRRRPLPAAGLVRAGPDQVRRALDRRDRRPLRRHPLRRRRGHAGRQGPRLHAAAGPDVPGGQRHRALLQLQPLFPADGGHGLPPQPAPAHDRNAA